MAATLYSIIINDLKYHIFCKFATEIDDVEITITDGIHSFNGRVTKDEIINLADAIEKDHSDYYHLMKECFCGNDNIQNKFTYQLQENDDSSFKFTWKQCMNDGEILFQLGSMKLYRKPDSSNVLTAILDSAMNQLKVLKTDVLKLRTSNEQLQKDKEYMVEKLKEYANAKDSLEKNLYSKFSLVLNEKKARIRELKDKVDMKSDVLSSTSTEGSQKKKLNDSLNSDEELGTDEEKEKRHEVQPLNEANKATSSVAVDPLFNDIIHDDDGDDDKPRKTRKRMRSNRPRTPVIPRTSSLPRPHEIASQEKTSSMVKRKSNELSTDDLLAEL